MLVYISEERNKFSNRKNFRPCCHYTKNRIQSYAAFALITGRVTVVLILPVGKENSNTSCNSNDHRDDEAYFELGVGGWLTRGSVHICEIIILSNFCSKLRGERVRVKKTVPSFPGSAVPGLGRYSINSGRLIGSDKGRTIIFVA